MGRIKSIPARNLDAPFQSREIYAEHSVQDTTECKSVEDLNISADVADKPESTAQATEEESDLQSEGSNSSDETSSDDEEVIEDPATLRMRALELKHSDPEEAIRLLSNALSQLTAKCSDETDPELAVYWMDYGNVLLIKEEKSQDILAESNYIKGEEPALDTSDEELAWQSLELARVSFEKSIKLLPLYQPCPSMECVCEDLEKLELVEPNGKPSSLVSDFAFTRLRLGDLFQVQMKYEDSAGEFLESLWIALHYGLSPRHVQMASIPLAQTLRVLGKLELSDRLVDATIRILRYLSETEEQSSIPWEDVIEDLQLQQKESKALVTERNETREQFLTALNTLGKDRVEQITSSKTGGAMSLQTIMENLGISQQLEFGKPAGLVNSPSSESRVEVLEVQAVSKKRKKE